MTELMQRILPTVQKPARYTGGEWGEIKKNLKDVRVRVAFCFPDTYEIGMSNLGMRILYGVMNGMDGVWCERVFAPWGDMEQAMRDNSLPLWALESQTPVREFDMIAFTIGYEMAYSNILNMLNLAGVPLRSKDRQGLKNIVFAGGVCAFNPEPLADFIDFFSLGEGEDITVEILQLYDRAKAEGWSKDAFLHEVAKIPGVYVPSFYRHEYNADGTLAAIVPLEGVPQTVTKRIIEDLDNAYFPTKMIVPSTEIVHDRANLEVFRGCIRGCRFCQAGFSCRPVRKKSPEVLYRQAVETLRASGNNEITISSLSTSDYRGLKELTDKLIPYCTENKVSLSVPSLRADNFSRDLMERLQAGGRKSSLTFAPEAGTQRLRDVINKNLTEDEILTTCANAFSGGWNNVKLYFMMGLPTETYEDLDGISDICKKVAFCWRENTPNRARGVRITASASCFVPKPQTPFQWDAQDTLETFREKQAHLKVVMKTKNVTYNWHDAETSVLEGVIARGDRRQGRAILLAWQRGCKMDGWDQCFDFEKWIQAFRDCGLDPEFYASRQRPMDEVFPWDHIGCGTRKEHLKREWERSREAVITPDCMHQCAGCGASALLKGGKCRV